MARSSHIPRIEEIKRLQFRAQTHYLYKREKDKDLNHIEAFLVQTTLFEGVLTDLGLELLKHRGNLSALLGKRNERYGYDNAINDLYLLEEIDTDDFKMLEKYKNKRNDFIHNILSDDIKTTAKSARSLYKEYEMFVSKMIKKLEKKLPKTSS